jgi:hypothetical protein
MLRPMSTAHAQTRYMAILCAGAFLVAYAGFYVMSGSYFDSHHDISPAQMTYIRASFAVFASVVAAFGFAAGIRPREIGHLIPALLGVFHLIASLAAFGHHDVPAVVGVTLLISGVMMPVLAFYSYRGSRPAWAFLIAVCGVFAVVEFFGAPKIRDAMGSGVWTWAIRLGARNVDEARGGLWIAMILPGLSAVATAALASLRGTYVERDA